MARVASCAGGRAPAPRVLDVGVRQNWSVRRHTTSAWAGFAVVLAVLCVATALAPHRTGFPGVVLDVAPFVFGAFAAACAVQGVRSVGLSAQRDGSDGERTPWAQP